MSSEFGILKCGLKRNSAKISFSGSWSSLAPSLQFCFQSMCQNSAPFCWYVLSWGDSANSGTLLTDAAVYGKDSEAKVLSTKELLRETHPRLSLAGLGTNQILQIRDVHGTCDGANAGTASRNSDQECRQNANNSTSSSFLSFLISSFASLKQLISDRKSVV